MIGDTAVKGGIEVEYDSVTLHYADEREPRFIDCVTDFARSRHFRTGEASLQILHQSCEGERGHPSAFVVKPVEVPLSDIDRLVLRTDGHTTTTAPEELLNESPSI